MKFKFFDTQNNNFIETVTIGDYDYYPAVEADGSIIGVCWNNRCFDPKINLDSKGIIVYRYTEICDRDGTEIYEGDSVELPEHCILSNSVKKRVWTVKFKRGHWVINFLNEFQDLYYVAHKVKVVTL